MERLGQYVLLEKVAAGGMAELFRAKKIGIEGFEQVLAVKRILPHLSSDEEFVNMFIAEAKLVAQLTHKNIAHIYDFGRIDQNYFISMEYIKGKDLKALLKKVSLERRKLPAGIAVFIAKEVAAALGYAHIQKDSAGNDLNIIHRDISPQNILVSYDGEVKIVDFG
ncbi:MAG: serine/threonine-protein kinase, partial [Nitrospirota bacterium]|nr:serine/threonine-protein kinase [Nitrospirota bacterium]